MGGRSALGASFVNAILPAEVDCPWCYEVVVFQIDTLQGPHETIEDCSVCCRPILLQVECEPGHLLDVIAEPG